MLDKFFELNAPYKTFLENEFEEHFKYSRDMQNVRYEPEYIPNGMRRLKNFTFKNVSFSKTKFLKITINECTFKECLFIGCSFDDVDFYKCKFIDCNFYKSTFNGCFLDPESFSFSDYYKTNSQNVMVVLFHSIYENSSKQKQYKFERLSDIKFRRWKRYQLYYDYEKENIGKYRYLISKYMDLFYDTISRYGYSPLRFILFTFLIFNIIALISNFIFITDISKNSHFYWYVDGLFFTVSMMTGVGFSLYQPSGVVSKLWSVGLAWLGVGWVGVFTAILVKRFLR